MTPRASLEVTTVGRSEVEVLDAGLSFRGELKKRACTDYVILHHAGASTCTVQDVHRWHLDRGWAGIGYHYLVRKDGTVFCGRPEDAIGAHCRDHNHDSVGICAEGDYTREQMPPQQEEAIIRLVRQLLRRYPGARVVGHRELVATTCPGQNYPLERIRRAVEGTFGDIDGHWAQEDIEWLARQGLVRGDENGNFRPDQPLTRAEAAVLVRRVIDYLLKAR